MEKTGSLDNLAGTGNKNAVENQFLQVVSQELQTLQSVIEEANNRIVKLQSEIATTSRVTGACGRSYGPTGRLPQHLNPDVPPEDAMARSSPQRDAPKSNEAVAVRTTLSIGNGSPSKSMARASDDPDMADTEDVQAQFERIDTSKNGFLSAQELAAIAITHGQQVTVRSVVNAVKYLNGGVHLVSNEEGANNEASSIECDKSDFIRLRSDPALIEEAPPEIAPTLLALHKSLEDESDNHMFETSKAKFNQRQRSALLQEAMDVGIVFVIAVNAAIIGIAIDTPQHSRIWEVVEIVFFSIYLLEFIVKNAWWGVRNYFCGTDFNWNLFDFFCLLVSAVELILNMLAGDSRDGPSELNLLKVLRLARLFRLVRIMRFKMFKELKLMAMGLLSGIRALAWAIVLLMVVIYMISIVTKSFFGHQPEFSSVGAGMFTLFRCFTEACETYQGDPIPEKLYETYGFDFQVAYILVTMLVTVGLFNLILAVFIDNVTKSQNQRKQKELGDSAIETEVKLKMLLARFINEPDPSKAQSHMMERFSEDVTSKLSNLTDVAKKRHQLEQRVCADEAFKLLKECNINITRAIFQAWLQDAEFVRVLDEADVDISNRFELFNILDVDLGGELSPHELLTGLLSLRGDVTKGDVIYILLRVRDMTHRMEQLQQDVRSLTSASPGSP